ncbi:MAG: hypothetical protein PHW27_09080 [Melioribacteraceae bacterium]|nr:hypothetical protein [Melioribacteraceae bacterium]
MNNIYKLKLKLKSGLLSEMHSDTIWGHFAWRFFEEHGDEKFKTFLQLYLEGKPVFSVSDGMFELEDYKNNIHEHFFPKPLKLTPYKIKPGSKKERIIQMIAQKESKKHKLISLKQLNYFINGSLDEFDKSFADEYHSQIEYPSFKSDLRVSVQIDREKMSHKESGLFSYSPKYLGENLFLIVLVKIIDQKLFDEFECSKILNSVFEIGFGKKKSSGFGQFEVLSFDKFNGIQEPKESNGYLNLSHYIPAESDEIDDIFYSTNVKYGKLGEQSSTAANPFKAPIIFLEPGTCVLTKKQSDFLGKAVNKINDYKPDVVQSGIAFTIKSKL